MAAPIRFLSGRQQQQKIGIEGSTEDTKVLEVVGRAGIGTTSFDPTVQLEVRGDAIVEGTTTVGKLEITGTGDVPASLTVETANITGVSTFGGAVDVNAGLDVDGQADLDEVVVAGVATFSSAVDINSTLDVDGDTQLDDLTVAGVATFSSAINATDIIKGYEYTAAPFGSTVTLAVTVASKDSTHRYNGTGSGNGYVIDGIQAPFLTLTPGRTYRFTNDNTGSHPLKFYLEADKTTLYETNVDFQDTYTEITVTDETPTVLHYQCTAHQYMGNAVQTNANVVNTNYPATIRSTLDVTGVSTFPQLDVSTGGLDVDGLTNLDELIIAGVTTFQNAVNFDVNSEVNIGTGVTFLGDNLHVTGIISATSFIGDGSGITNLPGISTLGSSNLTDVNVSGTTTTSQLRVSGIGTAEKFVVSTGGLDVDGQTDLDELIVSGVSTFQGNIVAATAEFSGNVTIGGTLTVEDKTNVDSIGLVTARTGVRVIAGGIDVTAGISTFGALVDVNNRLDVVGGANIDQVNVSGVSTFGGNVDVNAALDVSGNITGTGDFTLTDADAGSAAGPELKLYRNSSSPADADYLGQIKFAGESDTGVERNYAKITGKISDASNATEDGIIEFAHIKAGSQTITGRWKSTELQLLNDTDFSVAGDSTFTGAIDANGSLDVDGQTDLDELQVAGVSTFTAYPSIDADNEIQVGTAIQLGKAGVVTATTFSGALSGTATNATHVTVTDNESTDEENLIAFVENAQSGSGNHGLEMDGNLTYNPSSGRLSATSFSGDGSNLTGIGTQGPDGEFIGITVAGISTFNDNITVTGTLSATTLSGSDVSVTGDIGAAGIITATGMVLVAGSGLDVGAVGVLTALSLDISTGGIDVDGQSNLDEVAIAGVTTFSALADVNNRLDVVGGANIDQVNVTGISSFKQLDVSTGGLDVDGQTDLDELVVAGIATFQTHVELGDSDELRIGDADDLQVYHNGSKSFIKNSTGALDITTASTTSGSDININSKTHVNINVNNTETAATFIGNGAVALYHNGSKKFETTSSGAIITGVLTATSYDIELNDLSDVTTSSTSLLLGDSVSTNSTENTVIGQEAGANINARKNTFVGYQAGKYIVNEENTAIGNQALAGATGSSQSTIVRCVAVGDRALKKVENGANDNTAVGTWAGENCTTGNSNALFGYAAGQSITTGDMNVLLGYRAGAAITTSDDAIAIGGYALDAATSVSGTVAIGYQAGSDITTGSWNTLVGMYAGVELTTGRDNCAYGFDSLYENITGSYNVAVGVDALYNALGDSNVAIGYDAGDVITTGENNICIGYQADASSATASNEITLGNSGITTFRIPGIGVTFGEGGADISGIVTAVSFSGDGSNLTGIAATDHVSTFDLVVAGISTFNNEVSINHAASAFSPHLELIAENSYGGLLIAKHASSYPDLEFRSEAGGGSTALFKGVPSETVGSQSMSGLRLEDNKAIIFGTGNDSYMRYDPTPGVLDISTVVSEPITFNTNETERLRIAADGLVSVSGIVSATGITVVAGAGLTAGNTGVITAVAFHGDGSALTGIAATDHVSTFDLVVAGVSTFHDDVKFTSATSGLGVLYDRSADTLKLLEDGSDNTKLTIGDNSSYSSYMQIYHDGGNSGIGYINYAGSNKMVLSGNTIEFMNTSRNESMLTAAQNGAVSLYHNNLTRLATSAEGIDVTGRTETDLLNVSGVSTFSGIATHIDTLHGQTLKIAGVSTFSDAVKITKASNALDVNVLTTNDAIRIQNYGTTIGALAPTSGNRFKVAGRNKHLMLSVNDNGGSTYGIHMNSASRLILTATHNDGVGVSGIVTATAMNVVAGSGYDAGNTGVVTAVAFHGDGSALTGVGTAHVSTFDLVVAGISTFNDNVVAGAGLTVTGISTFNSSVKFPNDAKALFGSVSGLEIYHAGSGNDSYIQKGTEGNLRIQADQLFVRNRSGSEYMMIANANQQVELYYDGTKRFETTTDGVDISGTGSIKVPVGTTAQRNSSPTAGDFRYNSDDGAFEGYTDSWGSIGGGTPEVDTNVSSTSAVGVGSFATASFRSAEVIAQIVQIDEYQVGKYLMIHDGTTVTVIEQAAVATGDSMLGSFDGAINGSNAELRVNMVSSGIATVTTKISTVTI